MTTTTTKKNKLIDSDSRRGAYHMIQARAIIQHHSHGRLLLVEGFGGTDTLEGGCYRWKHGTCYKISETDTLESLFDECNETGFSDVDGLYAEEFSGKIINRIAESVGI